MSLEDWQVLEEFQHTTDKTVLTLYQPIHLLNTVDWDKQYSTNRNEPALAKLQFPT